MGATAAHPTKIYVRSDATTPGSGDEMANIDNYDFGPTIDLLAITDFKDTSGAKKKLAALTDGTLSVSGPADLADTQQNLIRAAALSGADLYLQVLPNPAGSSGQKGYSVVCKAKGFKLSGSVDGRNDFSGDLEFNGTPALV